MQAQLWIRALEISGQLSIPGLGYFRAEISPSKISFGEKTISPPNLLVEFEMNDEAREDPKLVDLLANDWNISPELARQFLIRQFEHIHKELSEKNQFSISGFGALQKLPGNIIRFIPEEGMAFLPDSYGLPKLSAETLQTSVRQQVKKEIPIIPLRPFDETSYQKPQRKSRGPALKWVAAASVFLALGISAGSVWYLAQPGETTAANQQPFAQEASIVTLSNPEKPKPIDEPMAVEMPLTENAEKKSSASTQAIKSQYFVIAGSFKLAEKSSNLQKSLIFRGYGSQLIPNPEKGTTRVSVAQFSSKEGALNFIKQAQELFEEQLWILEQ